jgi:hypothetical protein
MLLAPSVDEVEWLRDNSPAWRLLRADNAPLVLSFLHRVFVADNVRSISENEITYLAFPVPDAAMVIFGGRYAVPVLAPLGVSDTYGPSVRLEQERISFAAVEKAVVGQACSSTAP